jgi:hypothetical protein
MGCLSGFAKTLGSESYDINPTISIERFEDIMFYEKIQLEPVVFLVKYVVGDFGVL